MPKLSAVEAAHRRCSLLTRIVEQARDQALANPAQERWVKLELTAAGDKPADAVKKIELAFDELLNLLNHLSILDMASSFEHASRARVSTRIGEARSALTKAAKKSSLPSYHSRLVRETGSFDGLATFADLLAGHVDEEISEGLGAIRESRNTFAHGTELEIAPKVTRQEALSVLKTALESL